MIKRLISFILNLFKMEPTIDEDGKDPSVMPDLMPDLGEDSPETQ